MPYHPDFCIWSPCFVFFVAHITPWFTYLLKCVSALRERTPVSQTARSLMPRTSRASENLCWLNQWSRFSKMEKKTLLWTFAENVFILIWICTLRNIDRYHHLPHPHDCPLYPQISHLSTHSGILLCFIFTAELLCLQLQRWQTGFFPGSLYRRFYPIQSSQWIWIKK
jgi:hypothetical protein